MYTNNSFKMASSVDVSVEAVNENQIQEVTLDGQEIYVQPLSMSENLTKLAHKIDFSKIEGGDGCLRETSETEKSTEEEEKELSTFQPALWPWESVQNKLRNAMTEISVLADVLNIAKEKHYMVLDPISQEPLESKPIIQLLAKKKALAGAASILISGAERLRKSQFEMNMNRSVSDFHLELLSLRQNWRLKKVGNTIRGDLCYKTAGSRFWQGGTFEVSKGDDLMPNQLSPPAPNIRHSSLKVTIPSELEGVSYIQVTILKDTKELYNAKLTIPHPQGILNTDSHWQQKLEVAQNVLFCRELFSQLAREAVQLKSSFPNIVVGNQITSTLFPGIQLSIGLCHCGTKDKIKVKHPEQKPDHNHVLEHSLHQLLREVHHRNMHLAMPHPASAMLGIGKRRRLAGPKAFSRAELQEMTTSEALLELIVKQAKHVVLRKRMMKVIDDLVLEIRDPQIVAHWNCLNSSLQSCLKINIMTPGYEVVCRTSIALHVSIDTIKAVCRDGRMLTLSYSPQEVKDLLLCQISQHQVQAMQTFSKVMGWQTLSVCNHVGFGDVEPLGNASSIIMASPNGEKVIAVRCGPLSGIRVSVQSCPRQRDCFHSNVVKDRMWDNLGGHFKEVNWNKMEGKTFLSKMELLMASLTNC